MAPAERRDVAAGRAPRELVEAAGRLHQRAAARPPPRKRTEEGRPPREQSTFGCRHADASRTEGRGLGAEEAARQLRVGCDLAVAAAQLFCLWFMTKKAAINESTHFRKEAEVGGLEE